MSNQARFDELAPQWDSNPMRQKLASGVADAIISALPFTPAMRVMDFGAGTGLVTLRIAPKVGELVAADLSSNMLAMLGQKLAMGGITNVRTLQWDAEQGDAPEGGFDAIVSSMALHHVRDTEALFRRLAKALAPGGWVAVADLDAEDGTFHADPTGVQHHGFDRADLRRLLERAGFEHVAVRNAHTTEREGRSYGVFLAVGRVPAAK